MPRITRVYTKQGDDGTTRLASGQRVPKHDPRIEAYGTVDELGAVLGVARAGELDPEIDGIVATIQNELFHLGSDLSTREEDKARRPVPRIEERHVTALERHLDRFTEELGPLENFILAGGSAGAAQLHVARTVCRRAERAVARLGELEPIGSDTLRYLNRLSDALFVLARLENRRRGVTDVLWDSRT